MPITEFQGEHRFLSNFWHSPITVEGHVFETVEHAFQAMKTLDEDEKLTVANCRTPGEAKRAGRAVTLRADWNDIRLDVMANLLALKFAWGSPLAERLLATGSQALVEGNRWGDTFWGVCRGKGENHLGRLLMHRRLLLSLEDS